MEEEFTTAMHAEMFGDKISLGDLKIMGVYGAIKRGLSKKIALSNYGITEKEYDSDIERVLNQ